MQNAQAQTNTMLLRKLLSQTSLPVEETNISVAQERANTMNIIRSYDNGLIDGLANTA